MQYNKLIRWKFDSTIKFGSLINGLLKRWNTSVEDLEEYLCPSLLSSSSIIISSGKSLTQFEDSISPFRGKGDPNPISISRTAFLSSLKLCMISLITQLPLIKEKTYKTYRYIYIYRVRERLQLGIHWNHNLFKLERSKIRNVKCNRDIRWNWIGHKEVIRMCQSKAKRSMFCPKAGYQSDSTLKVINGHVD